MRVEYSAYTSLIKRVLFIILFAILLSRIITAFKKLHYQEQYAHSYSTNDKYVEVLVFVVGYLNSATSENDCVANFSDDWYNNLNGKL